MQMRNCPFPNVLLFYEMCANMHTFPENKSEHWIQPGQNYYLMLLTFTVKGHRFTDQKIAANKKNPFFPDLKKEM